MFNGKSWNLNSLLSSTCKQIKDLKDLTKTQEMKKNEDNKCTTPKEGFVKINFDDALSTRKQKARIEIVVLNSRRENLKYKTNKRIYAYHY